MGYAKDTDVTARWNYHEGMCGSCLHYESRGSGHGICHDAESLRRVSPRSTRSCWVRDDELTELRSRQDDEEERERIQRRAQIAAAADAKRERYAARRRRWDEWRTARKRRKAG